MTTMGALTSPAAKPTRQARERERTAAEKAYFFSLDCRELKQNASLKYQLSFYGVVGFLHLSVQSISKQFVCSYGAYMATCTEVSTRDLLRMKTISSRFHTFHVNV